MWLACAVLALLAGAASAAAATYTVTMTADTAVNDANCQPTSCSLRQAITKAVDGDTVILPASPTPYLVSNGQLAVLHAITIKGAGPSSSVIDATGNHDRVMLINGNSSTVKLDDLTITGGDTTLPAKAGGGGIAAGGPGPVVLTDVDVVGNTVNTTMAGANFNQGGGGIFTATSLILTDSTVSNNHVVVAQSQGDSGGGGILVIAANTARDANGNCSGAIDSDGYNLTDDPSSANTCSLTATGDVVNATSSLGPLHDNGVRRPQRRCWPGARRSMPGIRPDAPISWAIRCPPTSGASAAPSRWRTLRHRRLRARAPGGDHRRRRRDRHHRRVRRHGRQSRSGARKREFPVRIDGRLRPRHGGPVASGGSGGAAVLRFCPGAGTRDLPLPRDRHRS